MAKPKKGVTPKALQGHQYGKGGVKMKSGANVAKAVKSKMK